MRSVSKFFGKR